MGQRNLRLNLMILLHSSCLEPVEKAVLIAFLIYLMTLALVTSACSLLTAHSDYRAIDLHLFQVNIEVLSMSF
jgi:ABC-type transport system involved in multi-copper enzyme maturation permease subunit